MNNLSLYPSHVSQNKQIHLAYFFASPLVVGKIFLMNLFLETERGKYIEDKLADISFK